MYEGNGAHRRVLSGLLLMGEEEVAASPPIPLRARGERCTAGGFTLDPLVAALKPNYGKDWLKHRLDFFFCGQHFLVGRPLPNVFCLL